ncbi:hypothetical protein CYY_001669 [Polysphondylium violaceum]|uniref:F-box domain-containing protein n=1 Tax=Polysphondylium violaceum TaxID=133409 RepID=A0A8J4Q2Q7_9MYCE|nr:hypothetical protein CYY_001669 [Polysphondylium violaceum]
MYLLPQLALKQILEFIYCQDKYDFTLKTQSTLYFAWTIRYALVNKQWFTLSKSILRTNICLPIWIFENINSNSNSDFRIITQESAQHIPIKFIMIKECVQKINTEFPSIKSITIRHSTIETYGQIIHSLVYLNNLNKLNRINHITINFDLSIREDNPPWYPELLKNQAQLFKFKTNHIEVYYEDGNHQDPGKYIYQIIKILNPKSLAFNSEGNGLGRSHLKIFHSLSKLDNQFQSVEIRYDYIPLYSLYRFLQSPTLKTFRFNLQFHFLSALYNNNGYEKQEKESEDENQDYDSEYSSEDEDSDEDEDEEYEGNGDEDTENAEEYFSSDNNFNFNVMDNFRFKTLYQYRFKKQSCVKNNVNEDNQVYCTYDDYGDNNSTVPIYSKQLWKECLQLLANNKTITDLSIGYARCGEECFGKGNPTDQQLIDDLLDSLSNNQSIKRLCFNLCDEEICYAFMKPEFIFPLLQRNTTLENIYAQVIDYDKNDTLKSMIEDLSRSMPSNSKCKIKFFRS